MPTKEKVKLVEDLTKKLKNNNGVVLTEYQGLTVAELSELRAKLRLINCEYKVVKNTLSKLALKDVGPEDFKTFFEGPTAIAIEKGDPVSTAKTLVDFAKDHAKLKLKAALLDGKLIGVNEIKQLASLPSRPVMLSRLLGTLQAPMRNLLSVLQGTTRNMVYVLDAIRRKQEGNK